MSAPLLDRLRNYPLYNTAELIAETIAEIERLNAEIERWRDSNIRLRDEIQHQADRATRAEWRCAAIRECAKDMLSTYRTDELKVLVTAERQEAWAAVLGSE